VTTVKDYERVMDGLGLNQTEQAAIGGVVEASSGIKLEEVKQRTLEYWLFYNIVAQFVTHKVESEVRRARLQAQMARLF
jgi:hypothetical protein